MDENRITGAVKELGGKVQVAVGDVAGDRETQTKGIANEAKLPDGRRMAAYGKRRRRSGRLGWVGSATAVGGGVLPVCLRPEVAPKQT